MSETKVLHDANDPPIALRVDDRALFDEELSRRRLEWEGKQDLHGSKNSPASHAVGVWCELGAMRWLESHGFSVEWSGRRGDHKPDLTVSGTIPVEVKGQQPRNWTPKFATTLQKPQLASWNAKKIRYVIWMVCALPESVNGGLASVWAKACNTFEDVAAAGPFTIAGKQQYRTYPNQRSLDWLMERLREDARSTIGGSPTA